MRVLFGFAAGAVIGFAVAWAIFERPWSSESPGPSVADAQALARREVVTREQSRFTIPVEARAVDCERQRDEYSCAVALNVPGPDGGEAFVTLAIYNDKELVVRDYRGPELVLP